MSKGSISRGSGSTTKDRSLRFFCAPADSIGHEGILCGSRTRAVLNRRVVHPRHRRDACSMAWRWITVRSPPVSTVAGWPEGHALRQLRKQHVKNYRAPDALGNYLSMSGRHASGRVLQHATAGQAGQATLFSSSWPAPDCRPNHSSWARGGRRTAPARHRREMLSEDSLHDALLIRPLGHWGHVCYFSGR